MVYCRNLKDGKCSYTGGKCIISNPNTIEDYKVCPQRKLAKDYDEMDMVEKAFDNSVKNKNRLNVLETIVLNFDKRLSKLENRKQKKQMIPKLQKEPPIETVQIGLDNVESFWKDWRLFKWLRKQK